MSKKLILPLFIVIAIFAVAGYYGYRVISTPRTENQEPPILNIPHKGQVACTMEAKLCPDGSYVSRTGPNCEFTACPGDETAGLVPSGVEGWKTYQNEEYGLEFKHPADLVMRKRSVEELNIYWDGKLNGVPYVMTLGYISQNTLNTMGITYCGAHPEDTRCENFRWGNLSVTIDWNIETEGAFTKSRAEIQHPNGGVVIISIDHRPTQDIKTFFRQILSTFKFTQ